MWEWTRFGLSSGESLFFVGILDMMLAISSTCESYAAYFHKIVTEGDNGRLTESEFSHHLAYAEMVLLVLETCKIGWSLLFWIGGLILGKHKVLNGWIYISIIQEVVLQLVIWVSEYHYYLRTTQSPHSSTPSPTLLVARLTYSALIRVLIRACLVINVILFVTRWTSPQPPLVINEEAAVPGSAVPGTFCEESHRKDSSTSSSSNPYLGTILSTLPGPSSLITGLTATPSIPVPEDIQLLPVGSGMLNTLRFYSGDVSRIIKLFLTIDLTWGISRLLEREMTQVLFGEGIGFIRVLPISSASTPIFTEERIIRTVRVGFDSIFLRNMYRKKPPFQGSLILPRLVEILVSLGILIFIRIVDYASALFTLFYIFFIFDLLFRLVTFILCYKAYGDFLCRRHKHTVTTLANKNLKRINSVIK